MVNSLPAELPEGLTVQSNMFSVSYMCFATIRNRFKEKSPRGELSHKRQFNQVNGKLIFETNATKKPSWDKRDGGLRLPVSKWRF